MSELASTLPKDYDLSGNRIEVASGSDLQPSFLLSVTICYNTRRNRSWMRRLHVDTGDSVQVSTGITVIDSNSPEMSKQSKMKILVTGGAGYIGSFMTRQLLDQGHSVVVADSLTRGHKDAVDKRAHLLVGDLVDQAFVKEVLSNGVDVVIHFAGFIAVGESMKDPGMYFRNNTAVTMGLLEGMEKAGVNKIIFSSTAAVYGNPIEEAPIPEDHPKNPTSPYGQSKLMTEQTLKWYQEIYGLRFAALRYFNACGAALDGSLGEAHEPETHIIPNAVLAALNGTSFKLFGEDYNTPDGTCVRDYIHVLDLVAAHELAMQKLVSKEGGFQYNVGTGTGYTNRQVVEAVQKVSGVDFPVIVEGRRFGDPDMLIADSSRIKKELGFKPKFSDLDTIVSSAWKWHKKKHKK